MGSFIRMKAALKFVQVRLCAQFLLEVILVRGHGGIKDYFRLRVQEWPLLFILRSAAGSTVAAILCLVLALYQLMGPTLLQIHEEPHIDPIQVDRILLRRAPFRCLFD